MSWLRTAVLGFALGAGALACGGGDGGGAIDARPMGGDAANGADAGPTPDGGNGSDAGMTQSGGHTGSGNVAGGVKASSPNYRLIGTTRSGDGTAKSPAYQMRGGVIGATQ